MTGVQTCALPISEAYSSLDQPLLGFLISKNEITNKQFCYFLNVDSIHANAELIKNSIDLSHADSKIYVKEGKYCPVEGYADCPVVLVSWWGAKKYCYWLTSYVNTVRDEKGLYRVPNYRLPSEYEWLVAAHASEKYKYSVEAACDSTSMYSAKVIQRSYDVKLNMLNTVGVAGMNENVFEWTEDDFYMMQAVIDFSLSSFYYKEITADAVVRKHGFVTDLDCGRISRLRSGYYSDTGFRIVQTYLGRSAGAEF